MPWLAWLSEALASGRLRRRLKILSGKYPPTMAELSRKVSLKELVTNSYFELSVKVKSLCW